MSNRAPARWLRWLLPRELREEYGGDFVALFEERLAEEGENGGRAAAFRYWLHGLADVLRTAFWLNLQKVRPAPTPEPGLPESGAPGPEGWRVSSWLDAFLQDLKYGWRQLRRNPGFTAVAVLTLALGIGVNAAVFNLVNARLLRLPPMHDPEALVSLWQSNAARPDRPPGYFSYPDYLDYRERNDVFSGLLAARITTSAVSGGSYPEQIFAEQVSGDYFEVLGVAPSLGRALRPTDDDPGAQPSAVISHELWQRQFGGDRTVIGAELVLNGGNPFTIVGVAPEGYWGIHGGAKASVWYPQTMRLPILHSEAQRRSDRLTQRQAREFSLVGRLMPGMSVEQAQEATSALAGALAQSYPDTNDGFGVVIVSGVGLPPAAQVIFIRWSVFALVAAGLVLLIACVNISSMLFARSLDRSPEIAIRLSVGASRGRLLSQLLSESLLLAITSGAVGLLLANWTSQGLAAALPLQFSRDLDLSVDIRVVAFTVLASLIAAVLFGLAPAWRLSGRNLVSSLRGLTSGLQRTHAARKALLAAQVGASVVLLIGAGLFVRSLQSFNATEPGFEAENVLRASVWAGPFGYDARGEVELNRQLLERAMRLPGVRSGALGGPPYIRGSRTLPVWPAGRGPVDEEAAEQVAFNVVAVGYHGTLGIPLIRGREFSQRDADTEASVVVVSETMARRLWPDEDPIGEQITLLLAPPFVTERRSARVIGVTSDTAAVTRERALGSIPGENPGRLPPPPRITIPLWMSTPPSSYVQVYLKTAVPPTSLVPALREELQAIGPGFVLFSNPLADRWERFGMYERTYSTFTSLFAALAVALCAVGLYGTMAHAASLRTHEIGVRMALGARVSDVVGVVVRQGLVPTVIGLGVGIAAALALARVVASLLYEVNPTDPLTYAAVVAMIIGVALAASYVPARRATRVDPCTTLRAE